MPSYKLTFGDRILTYPGHAGYVGFENGPTYTYTTLWETNAPFNNMYSITLNDSIDNYDELIVYGSANRDNQMWLDTQNKYVVIPGTVQYIDPYYAGRWSTGSTYELINGTNFWVSGTSGYVSSSYFFGQGNNTTAWSQGTYTAARTVDLHPYKIVGVKEVQ